jgi:hypothetical protein
VMSQYLGESPPPESDSLPQFLPKWKSLFLLALL